MDFDLWPRTRFLPGEPNFLHRSRLKGTQIFTDYRCSAAFVKLLVDALLAVAW